MVSPLISLHHSYKRRLFSASCPRLEQSALTLIGTQFRATRTLYTAWLCFRTDCLPGEPSTPPLPPLRLSQPNQLESCGCDNQVRGVHKFRALPMESPSYTAPAVGTSYQHIRMPCLVFLRHSLPPSPCTLQPCAHLSGTLVFRPCSHHDLRSFCLMLP